MLKKKIGVLIAVVLSFLPYQNCGKPSHSNVSGAGIFFSGSCDSSLMNAFNRSYYGFFKQSCAVCHDKGPGFGQFANKDFQTAYNSFMSLGRSRVERNILNPSHQAGLTGPQNQSLVDAHIPTWQSAESQYTTCSGNTIATPGAKFASLGKASATIISRAAMANPWFKMEWDLENETAKEEDRGKYLMIGSIEIKAILISGVLSGYEFRNPTLRLKSNASKTYRVRGLHINISDIVVSDLTTYSLVDVVIKSLLDLNLAQGAANGLAVKPQIAATDSFAVSFDGLDEDDAPIDQPLPATVTFAQLISTDPSLGVFRQSCFSCHSGSNIRGNLDLSNYTTATARGAQIVARMNNATNPMPQSGLLGSRERELVRLWQTRGYPQ